jgi:AraC-like DNA-binding protein
MGTFSLLDAFFIAGALNGIILALAIYRARLREGRAWKYLCALVLVFSGGISANMVAHRYFSSSENHAYFIMSTFILIGPLVYFYIKTVSGGVVTLRHLLLNLLPLFTLLFFGICVFAELINENVQGGIRKAIHVMIGIQFVIYNILSYRILVVHAKRIAETYSSIEKIRLSWLRFIVFCFALAVLFAGITDLIDEYFGEESGWNLFWIYISCVVYSIGYKGLRQPEIWKDGTDEKMPAKKKYEKTAIDPVKAGEYRKLVEGSMDAQVFLDPELSMPALAEKLSIPVYHLSQVINESGMNFYEYVNRRRFEYAKKMIQTVDDPVNITRIAFDSGFNSISAFNAVFRKFGNMTPTDWKNSVRK